jgi:hypothetical protein
MIDRAVPALSRDGKGIRFDQCTPVLVAQRIGGPDAAITRR